VTHRFFEGVLALLDDRIRPDLRQPPRCFLGGEPGRLR